jgi:hypothetical protein
MKKICVTVILIIVLISLCGCENVSEEDLKIEKIDSECEYLESKVFYIVRQYVSGNYGDTDLDWNSIKSDFSQIGNSSSVIVIDLSETSLDKNVILKFEEAISSCENAISQKDLNNFLNSLCVLYSNIYETQNQFIQNPNEVIDKIIKSNLLNIIYGSYINDTNMQNECISVIENNFTELSKSQEYLDKNLYKLNKIYVEIQELKTAIQDNNQAEVINKYLDLVQQF